MNERVKFDEIFLREYHFGIFLLLNKQMAKLVLQLELIMDRIEFEDPTPKQIQLRTKQKTVFFSSVNH